MTEFGCVVELAALAAEVLTEEGERGAERSGPEIVDGQVAGHGDEIERTVEFAHGFVHEGCDYSAVDIAGRTFVQAAEVDGGGGGYVGGIGGIDVEMEVQTLRVVGAAAETVVGAGTLGGGIGGGVVFRRHWRPS